MLEVDEGSGDEGEREREIGDMADSRSSATRQGWSERSEIAMIL